MGTRICKIQDGEDVNILRRTDHLEFSYNVKSFKSVKKHSKNKLKCPDKRRRGKLPLEKLLVILNETRNVIMHSQR